MYKNKNFFDIIIVGGSLVGSALALGLSKNFSVALIEKNKIIKFNSNSFPDIRVSAINNTSIDFLKKLRVWQNVKNMRLSYYNRLETWELEKIKVNFDAKLLGLSKLGCIIENKVLKYALWEKLKNKVFYFFAELKNAQYLNETWNVELSNKKKISSKLLIGADGANSKVRELINVNTQKFKYKHDCIVFSIKCNFISGNITWQKFNNLGIFAFLPLFNNFASLVWYDVSEKIENLKSMTYYNLQKEIKKKFFSEKNKDIKIFSKKYFSLQRLHATSYIKKGAVLIGDSAHTINPIAGQGLNLGYKDAIVLIKILNDAYNKNENWFGKETLKKYEKNRYKDNLFMQNIIDLYYLIFIDKKLSFKFLRNLGMLLVKNSNFIKKKILSYALGLY